MSSNATKYRRHTDPNGGYDEYEIKRNKALTYFKQNALYFGLQYKPSSGAEWKMKYFVFVISAVRISVPSIFCILKFLLIQVYRLRSGTLIGLLLWLYSF